MSQGARDTSTADKDLGVTCQLRALFNSINHTQGWVEKLVAEPPESSSSGCEGMFLPGCQFSFRHPAYVLFAPPEEGHEFLSYLLIRIYVNRGHVLPCVRVGLLPPA